MILGTIVRFEFFSKDAYVSFLISYATQMIKISVQRTDIVRSQVKSTLILISVRLLSRVRNMFACVLTISMAQIVRSQMSIKY